MRFGRYPNTRILEYPNTRILEYAMTGVCVLTQFLSLLGLPLTVLVAVASRLGWWSRPAHIPFAIASTVAVLFAHTMTTMHLVDVRKQTRELSQEHNLDVEFLRKATILLKWYTPMAWLVILLIVPGFILAGAAHTKIAPGFVHWLPVTVATVLHLVAGPRGLWAIHESVELLWQVEHVSHGGTLTERNE